MPPIRSDSLQRGIPNNNCFGCGPGNEHGLQIETFWDGEETICTYLPRSYQTAGPPEYLNGGIMATLIDCHCICTAIANGYRSEGRPLGSEPHIWYATAALNVSYLKPAPIAEPVHLRAAMTEVSPKKTILRCTLSAAGRVCAEAEVVAVRVSESWRHGR